MVAVGLTVPQEGPRLKTEGLGKVKRLRTLPKYLFPDEDAAVKWFESLHCVELHLKLSQVLHLKVPHLEEPEYGSSVLGFSSFCLLGFLRRAVFEAVAIVAGFNDVAVMSQPVE